MQLLLSSLISGIGLGVIVGLLACAVVFLVKSTGVVNFAAGSITTFGAFLVYRLIVQAHFDYYIAVVIGIVAAGLISALIYLLAIRPKDTTGTLNAVIRTLALYLLIDAAIQRAWGEGQPFALASLLPTGTITFAGVVIPMYTVGLIVIAALLATILRWFFHQTKLGLLFTALAERPEIARLLGVNVRLLSAIAWGAVGSLSCLVGVLTAPAALLSTDMMSMYLLYAFTAAVLGGLNSLGGTFLGGIVVGCVLNVVTLYGSQDLGTFAVFGILLIVLLVKPNGFFGSAAAVRY